MLRASRKKDACSSWFVSTAEKSVFPQILWGARTLYRAAAIGAASWHRSFAAPAKQFFAAQRGAQTGARSKARTVTSANALAAGGQFRNERMSLIASHQSTPAHSRRQPAHLDLCFCITRGSVARRSVPACIGFYFDFAGKGTVDEGEVTCSKNHADNPPD